MIVYDLELLLNTQDLYCIYLVEDDTYITLITLLENFDNGDYSIPKEFREKNYISKLINLYNRQKNINIHTLKIKLLKPIFSRSNNAFTVEDGISLVGDVKDLSYNRSISPFGELLFGEDRGSEFLKANQTTFVRNKFNATIAVQQLKDSLSTIKEKNYLRKDTKSIWVVGRVDSKDRTIFSFANLTRINITPQKNIAISDSAEKSTENLEKKTREALFLKKKLPTVKEEQEALAAPNLPSKQAPPARPAPILPSKQGSRAEQAAREAQEAQAAREAREKAQAPPARPAPVRPAPARPAQEVSSPPLVSQQASQSLSSGNDDVWERLVDIKKRTYYYKNKRTNYIENIEPTTGKINNTQTIDSDNTYYKGGPKPGWIKFSNKYYYKYLKYKQKYLEAKKLQGGELHGEELQYEELQYDELQYDELQYDELQYDELQYDELEGGNWGDITFIFCPAKVYEIVQEIFSPTFKFMDKDFFLFCMGPKSFYTEEKSKKLCRCWGGCIVNFWENGLGGNYLFNFKDAKKEIEDKMPKGEITFGNDEQIPEILKGIKLTKYKYFTFKSVREGYLIDYTIIK
jgi:hypothetical protein